MVNMILVLYPLTICLRNIFNGNYKLIKTVDKLEKDMIELQREVVLLKQQNQELVDMLKERKQ